MEKTRSKQFRQAGLKERVSCTQSVGNLKVGVLLIGQRLSSGVCEFLLVLGHDFGVDLDFGRSQSGSGDEFLPSY
jgi:hypothetical protein